MLTSQGIAWTEYLETFRLCEKFTGNVNINLLSLWSPDYLTLRNILLWEKFTVTQPNEKYFCLLWKAKFYSRLLQILAPSFSRIHFNIVLQHTPLRIKSRNWNNFFTISHKTCACVIQFSQSVCYVPLGSRFSDFNLFSNIWYLFRAVVATQVKLCAP